MGFYEELGVAPVVNAAAALTALGGQLMPDEVLDAMREAAGSSVDMHELHLAAGRELARLTGNDAAYVTAGCAAAIVLALLGIRTGGDPGVLRTLAGPADAPDEVVVHAAHRIPYDPAIALAGCRIVQIGNALQTFDWELEAALTDRTAAVFFVAGSHLSRGALSLPAVVEIAHDRGVPVIVDAASQLPPLANLHRFTRDEGADLAVFSGGKALRGPQASGLLVGRADLVEAARQNGAPYQRWGRAMKAGKEEIAGLVAAMRRYVALDHDAIHRDWEATVRDWADALGATDADIAVDDLNEAGQPIPRVRVGFADPARVAAVLDRLAAGRPRVAVLPDLDGGVPRGLWLSPDVLRPGEAEVVRDAVVDAIRSTKGRP
jgi:uncharacterized pyridoxal phosphate-dependent enzyme